MPTRWHETFNGRFKVSSPELTALELVYRQQVVGGISRVFTVLHAMAGTLSQEGLQVALDRVNEVPSAQRLGVLLAMGGHVDLATLVRNWLMGKRMRVSPLSLAADDEPTQLDPLFRVRIPRDLQLANA